MSEFSEGDLIEATKGDTVIRGRLQQAPGGGIRPLFTVTDPVRFDPLHLESNGYTVVVVEKAAPALPTERGFYLDGERDLWERTNHGWNCLTSRDAQEPERYAPFTRLEPVDDTVEKLRAAARIVYPGANNSDADFMLTAAKNLEGHFEVGGSGVREAVVRVLLVVADAVEVQS